MPNTTEGFQSLSLTEELILMLLNEETGYFHQVPGWHYALRRGRGRACGAFSQIPHRHGCGVPVPPRPESPTGRFLPSISYWRKSRAEPNQQNTPNTGSNGWLPVRRSIIDSVLDRLVEMKDPGTPRRRVLDAGSVSTGRWRTVQQRRRDRVRQVSSSERGSAGSIFTERDPRPERRYH